MGGNWRMPTLDDFVELCQNTDIYLVTTEEEIKGNITTNNQYPLFIDWEKQASIIKGMKFYKKDNKETYLFVPVNGSALNGALHNVSTNGNLRFSSLDTSNIIRAYNLYFDKDDAHVFFAVRNVGITIRGISNP